MPPTGPDRPPDGWSVTTAARPGSSVHSTTLAQAPAAPSPAWDEDNYQAIILWSLAMVGLLIVGLTLVMWLKKRLKAADEPAGVNSAGFTLEDLRRMHRTGQMSDEEFERAKAKIIDSAQRTAERKAAEAAAAAPARGGVRDSSEDLRKARERAELRRKMQAPPTPPTGGLPPGAPGSGT